LIDINLVYEQKVV